MGHPTSFWLFANEPGMGILLDLDDTLVDTSKLKPLRDARRWREVYVKIPSTTVYDDTREFIQSVRRLGRVGIVTNSPRTYAELVVQHHALDLEVLVAYHDTKVHKPDPAPLLKAASVVEVPPINCAAVGNDADDWRAAERAGMTSLGIDRSSIGLELRNGTLVMNSLTDIAKFLKRLHTVSCLMLPLEVCESPEQPVATIAALPYVPLSRGGHFSSATNLVLDVKRNDLPSIFLAAAVIARRIGAFRHQLQRIAPNWTVAAIPTSRAGVPNTPCEIICSLLSHRFPGLLTHVPELLQRVEDVPKSATAPTRTSRPTPEQHYQTIRVTQPQLVRGRCVILIDDVYTLGAHTAACGALLRKSGATNVMAFPLSRTVWE